MRVTKTATKRECSRRNRPRIGVMLGLLGVLAGSIGGVGAQTPGGSTWYHGSKDAPLWVTPKTDRKPWHDVLDQTYQAQRDEGKAWVPGANVDQQRKQALQKSIEDGYKKALALETAAKAFNDAGRTEYEWAIELKLTNRRAEALDAFQRSINFQKKANPSDTILVGDCYIQMGQLKQNQGHPELATGDARRAYEIYSKLLPADDIKLEWPVDMLKQYAATPQDALPYAEQAIKITERAHPEDGGLIAAMLQGLAAQLANSGQLQKAIDTVQEAIDWCAKEPGNYPYSTSLKEEMDHWRRQLIGVEPPVDVIYGGKYAGRDSRSKPKTVVPNEDQKPESGGPEIAGGSGGRIYYVNGRKVSKNEYDAMNLSNEACDLLRAHQLQPALEKLMQCLKLQPDLAQAHANLGYVLSKLGQKESAVQHLREAVRLQPDNASPLSMLASVYQSNGQLDNAIEAYKVYAEKFSDEDDVYVVKALIKDLSAVRDKQRAVEQTHKPEELADNYLPYCVPHGKVRWGATIKVYLLPISHLHGYKPEFSDIAKNCFEEWVQKADKKVTFQFVKDRKDCDIDFYFTNNFADVSSPAEGGETKEYFDDHGHFKHCTVVLLTERASSNITPSENDVRAVALHEIGHAVGLMGHSPKAEDIMYCSAPDNTEVKRPELTPRDLRTLAKLYSE